MRLPLIVSLIASGVLLAGCGGNIEQGDPAEPRTLLVFHNNAGPMCIEALDWLTALQSQHPDLVIEEHLTYEPGESELLAVLEAQFSESQGVSTSFGYLPIIFFDGQAYSGFNEDVARSIEDLLDASGKLTP